MATLEQIQTKIKKLQEQAEAMLSKKSQAVLNEIRGLMEKHGLTTADIDAHAGGEKRGPKTGSKPVSVAKPSVAQYRDPKTGATWSGRGRAPGWIAKAKDRNRFLVADGAVTNAPVSASKPKAAGNYVRGVQAPKYRDPKSGATWSGRGPAPEWLAGAKDRNKFLIDAATTVTLPAALPELSKPVAKKAAKKSEAGPSAVAANKRAAKRATGAAKKVAPKKVAPKKVASKKVGVKRALAKTTSATRNAADVVPVTLEAPVSQSIG